MVNDRLAFAPGRWVAIVAVWAAISAPTKSAYVRTVWPVCMATSPCSKLSSVSRTGASLLQAAREAQLVMRGQRHRIRSSLLTTWSRGGHSSLRGLGRCCHMVLTTTQEFL